MPKAPHSDPGSPSITVVAPVGGPGTTLIVASDALLARAAAIGQLGEALRLSTGELLGIMQDNDAVAVGVPFDVLEGRAMMSDAALALARAHTRAEYLHAAVLQSREAYAEADRAATTVSHTLDEQVAWGIGQVARVLAIPLAVVAVEAVGGTWLLSGKTPGEQSLGLQAFLKQHGRILTNSGTVAIIREAGSDVDGFIAGFGGVPLAVADTLERAGRTGVRTSAESVILAGAVGGLFGGLHGQGSEDAAVSVAKANTFELDHPPTSLVDRVASFPDPHDDGSGAQVRIDRYIVPGKPDRFDVYVAGTVTFDPKAAAEPFDFTSDMRGVAGEPTASEAAVEKAMEAAGITPESPVVLNGYSQGGLVASLLAASGKYNVQGVVTFGAPSGQVHIPASIPVLTVRNTEDLVPATSGYDVNPNAVVVERSAFADAPVPSDRAVPAHRLDAYSDTAGLVDQSASPEVRSVLDPLNSFGSGSTRVESSLWLATRGDGHPVGPAAPASPAVGPAFAPAFIDGSNARARGVVAE